MSDNQLQSQLDNIYLEQEQWVQNTGETTIHAKRMLGHFRRLKWLATSVWLIFFLGPYLQYQDRQAILLDMEKRQYRFFDITILPSDIWLLAAFLLFAAIFLAMMTALFGRIFCGYFCFQTVWTDVYTRIEQFFEGNPNQRHRLDKSPWSLKKIRIKLSKHSLWGLIALLSGVTWLLWFGHSWTSLLGGEADLLSYAILGGIAFGVYIFAGFMREQTCLWICPYARIQGVMVDANTILPTYDTARGEPRERLKRNQKISTTVGDCIDCGQCIAVCPTGVDIRKGQEYGCITCGLCIDACDSVMRKINRATGLIRYSSLNTIKYSKKTQPFYQRLRVLIYASIIFTSLGALFYGFSHLGGLDLQILHDRQPLYVRLSDGSIRNKYQLRMTNKTAKTLQAQIVIDSDIKALMLKPKSTFSIKPYAHKDINIYLSTALENLSKNQHRIYFKLITADGIISDYQSTFYTPK